ncbi:MBL fold metallo-hydrolase [Saccharopolyspora taberi]|uniref:MBL fold metallo-hydrolase n=1 Tax=Saccharopolyspora taberi TaxID=60895 RepID=A0ABN3V2B3_9PSEU
MPADFHVTELSPATSAYLQPPGGWFRNNAGWITGRERMLLVDTCATEARSRRLLETARGSSSAALSAVLTHAHGDHSNGARLVAEAGGDVLASAEAARTIGTGPHLFPEVFVYSGWGEIGPPRITGTVGEPTRLDLGGRTAEIVPVAGTAHTDGDLVVWVPEDGVLFSGDLIFNGVTPLALHGRISGWLEALTALSGFDARHLVPGHGELTAPAEAIAAVSEYLRWLLDSAAADRPDFAALERQGRQRWPGWLDQERHAANLRLAHAEVHGNPPDLEAALAAMLRSAGGPIHLDL